MLKLYQLALSMALLLGCLNLDAMALARSFSTGHRRPNATHFTPSQTYQGAHQQQPVRPVRFNQTWSAPQQPGSYNYSRYGPASNVQNQPGRFNQTPSSSNRTWANYNGASQSAPHYQTTPQPAYPNWGAQRNFQYPNSPQAPINYGGSTIANGSQPIGWGARNNFSAPAGQLGNIGGQYPYSPQAPINYGGSTIAGGSQPIGWGARNNFSAPAGQLGNIGGQYPYSPQAPINSGGSPIANGSQPIGWGARNNFSAPAGQLGNIGGQYPYSPQVPINSGGSPIAGGQQPSYGFLSPNNDWQRQGQQQPGGNLAPLAPVAPAAPKGVYGGDAGVPLAPLSPNGGSQAALSYGQGSPGSLPKPNNYPYANLFT